MAENATRNNRGKVYIYLYIYLFVYIIRSDPTYIRTPFYNYGVWRVVYIILIFAAIARVPRVSTVNGNLLRDYATIIIETVIVPLKLSWSNLYRKQH